MAERGVHAKGQVASKEEGWRPAWRGRTGASCERLISPSRRPFFLRFATCGGGASRAAAGRFLLLAGSEPSAILFMHQQKPDQLVLPLHLLVLPYSLYSYLTRCYAKGRHGGQVVVGGRG